MKWEYTVVKWAWDSTGKCEDALNRLGSYGWELCSIVNNSAVFKRQVGKV